MATAFVAAPLIAWATRGRYYIARGPEADAAADAGPHTTAEGAYLASALKKCVICERDYEGPDMAHCPAYQGPICSLCCTLDARCGDLCKPHASLSAQWSGALRWVLPRRIWPYLDTGLGHFMLLMLVIVPLAGHGVWPAVPPGAARWALHWATPAAARATARCARASQGLHGAAGHCRHRGVVAGAGAQEPPGGAGGVQPPDAPADAEIESHKQTDEALQRPGSRPSRPATRPTRPTRPRAATSAPSATSCARRSTASWATRS
jgi:hypothetical protein